jgi:hypothetical protein
MPAIINSDNGVVSGSAGLKTSGANDGILVFQTSGTETARINTDSQIVAVAGTASLPALTFTGDLNTGIYSPGADRIGFAEGGVQVGEFDASGNFLMNSGYGSAAVAYGCRAWVNFNGTGTVAIRASGNVTSITDNGTGDYTVNFTTAMPDANYGLTGTCLLNNNTDTRGFVCSPTIAGGFAPATGSARISSVAAGVGSQDFAFVNVSIFR